MSEQQTKTVDSKTTIIDREMAPKDKQATSLVVDQSGRVVSSIEGAVKQDDDLMGFLNTMGFPTPIASPEQLRAAFEYQQKMYAAVLGENDYLYTVNYTSDNKQRNQVVQSLAEAQALTTKFANLGAVLNAKPKKSGIVKLARALGITASVKSRVGLPEDSNETYSFVEYTATHEATGKSETGVGWCDLGERGGRISKHDVIATADTRAYNRAVLRLAGFGDVSAEEIIAGPMTGDDAPASVPDKPKAKRSAALPPIDTDVVVAACRSWAEAVASRQGDQFAPDAQQDTREARELRAKARRGDARSAQKLGAAGLRWDGVAVDGSGYEPFRTGMPPVTPEQIVEHRDAVAAAKAASKTSGDTEAEKGWDLSSKGSDKDDEPAQDLIADPKTGEVAEHGVTIPQPNPASETITTAQAKQVSVLLKSIFKDVEEMKTWLKQNCHVDRTIHLRSNQYESAMVALKQMEKKMKEANANG